MTAPMTCLRLLVPVRNGADYLPRFLEEAATYADAVAALDDGSTDRTHQRLADSRLVCDLLANPVRAGFAGWDDLANRNALLQCLARAQYTGWVLFLDVDELLDSADAAVLRRFIDNDQLDRDYAYGLRVFRMVNDLQHFYKDPLTVYRLFYFVPGQLIQGGRLHFHPIPQQIPPSRWRITNLRIKHLSSLTQQLREARYAKYREADPGNEYQASYRNLLDAPITIRSWAETNYTQAVPLLSVGLQPAAGSDAPIKAEG